MNLPALTLMLAAVLAVTSCRNGQPTDSSDNNTAAADPTEDYQYRHLTGSVGDLPVTMELIREQQLFSYAGAPLYRGYYYYHKIGTPIPLNGDLDSIGQLVLTEGSDGEGVTGIFIGQWSPEGTFSGVWQTPDGARRLDFRLEATGQAVQLRAVHFADSLAAFPDREDSPRAYISEAWLLPAEGAPERAFLEAAIQHQMLGDSLAAVYSTPEEAFNYRKEVLFDQFREDATYFNQEDGFAPDYEQSVGMEVLYNDGRWLTIGFTAYAYMGGAHGNYGTEMATLDLIGQRAIELDDIFKPGYEEGLRPYLEGAARDYFGLEPGQPLSEMLFEDEIYPNDNFGLTGSGIFFNYVPYEIGPYAAGEIQLFLPFARISEWLQPAFKDRVEK